MEFGLFFLTGNQIKSDVQIVVIVSSIDYLLCR